MRHFCFMHNVMWRPKGTGTPWTLRHGEDFPADLHPFGSKVFYTPATTKANAAEHKFSPSSVVGIIVGYYLNPGGVWSKDYLVINLESALNGNASKHLPVLRVGKVYREKGLPVFPLKSNETAAQSTSSQIKDQGDDATQHTAEHENRPDPDTLPDGKYRPGAYIPENKLDPSCIPKGYEWQFGRITNICVSRRPPNVIPEAWNIMSKKQRKHAAEEWRKTNEPSSSSGDHGKESEKTARSDSPKAESGGGNPVGS